MTEIHNVPERFVASLTEIYLFESDIVNSEMHLAREFSVAWTRKEMIEHQILEGISQDLADECISYLLESNRLVVLDAGTDEEKYRTETAELVRLSSFNYQRFAKRYGMKPTQSGLTWSIERKETPIRSVDISNVQHFLKEAAKESNYYSDSLGQAIDLVLGAFGASIGTGAKLSDFQHRSIEQTLANILSEEKSNVAIVAGTGSGKSYGFQIGTLIAIVDEILSDKSKGPHSIFLYPRVALMLDQKNALTKENGLIVKINEFLSAFDKELRYVVDGGSQLKKTEYQRITGNDEEPRNISVACRDVYSNQENYPHLIFANPDTITYRLTNRDFSYNAMQRVKNIVFDEVHLLRNVAGANTAGVLRRMINLSEHDVNFIACSATISEPEEHIGKIVENNKPVEVINPFDDEMEQTGIVHHVFHKSAEGSSFSTNLTNLTSLITHGRRRRSINSQSLKHRHKTLGFADALHMLGTWEYQLMDNEGLILTKPQRRRMNSGEPAAELKPKDQPLPYRFNRPLVNYAKHNHPEKLNEYTEHCDNCVKNIPSTVCTISATSRIQLDHDRENSVVNVAGLNVEANTEIGITNNCPFFTVGACWREESRFHSAPLYDNGPRANQHAIYPIRLTSDSISRRKNDTTDMELFKFNQREYHKISRNSTVEFRPPLKIADIALGSPAIEVGMDFDYALDAVMFKAIRNISAYRQKIGRLGRERYQDVYSSMLVSFRAIDYYYYRNPMPLLSSNRVEAIPLGVKNELVLKQMAFHAVFDHLTRYCPYPGSLVASLNQDDRYVDVLNSANAYLSQNKQLISNDICGVVNGDQTICLEAINAVESQFAILLDENPELFQNNTNIAQRIGSRQGVSPPNPGAQFAGKRVMRLNLTSVGENYVNFCKNFNKTVRDIVTEEEIISVTDPVLLDCVQLLRDVLNCIENGKKIDVQGFETLFDPSHLRELAINCFTNQHLKLVNKINQLTIQLDDFERFPERIKLKIMDGDVNYGLTIADINKEASKPTFSSGFNSSSDYGWWYLRDMLNNIHSTKHGYPMTFTSKLYESSTEKMAQLGYHNGNEFKFEPVPAKELLFAHPPGTWSYRRTEFPMKTKAYKQIIQNPMDEDRLILPLIGPVPEEGEQRVNKHEFLLRPDSIPSDKIPWTRNQSNDVDILLYEPVRLVMMKSYGPDQGNKVVPSNDGPWILDGDDTYDPLDDTDENDEENERSMPINIPDCIPVQWRNLNPLNSTPILPYSGNVEILKNGNPIEMNLNSLFSSLFSSVKKNNLLDAQEYVLGHLRKYQGGDEVMVDYVATRAQQQQAAMGIQFNTVGIEFTLSDSIRDRFVESANQAVRGSCHATIYQVLTHLLRSEFQIGPFASDDVIRFALWKNRFAIPENLDSFVELIRGLEIGDFNEYRETLDAEMQDKSKTLENITHQIPKWEINSAKISSYVKDWAIRTGSNSLGICLLQAARELTGCQDQEVGYHVDVSGSGLIEKQKVTIWLYDRTPDGNGSCDTIEKWFEIPRLIREFLQENFNQLLPTDDFVSLFERYLRPCKSHEAMILSHYLDVNQIDPSVLEGDELYRDIAFNVNSYSEQWKKLREDPYPMDAKHFVYAKKISDLLENSVESEATKKATSGCHSSCVECLEEYNINMLGPLDGPFFSSKRLLDAAIRATMDGLDEYEKNIFSLDGIGVSLSDMGVQDLESELTLLKEGTSQNVAPMVHPDVMWSELNTEIPLIGDQINKIHRTKLKK